MSHSTNTSLLPLNTIPQEIWLLIIAYLDYPSLCCVERTSSFFKNQLLNTEGYIKLLINNVIGSSSPKQTVKKLKEPMDINDELFEDPEHDSAAIPKFNSEDFEFDRVGHDKACDSIFYEIQFGHKNKSRKILENYLFDKIMREEGMSEEERNYVMNYLLLEEFKFQSFRDVYVACYLNNVNPFLSWRKVLPSSANGEVYNKEVVWNELAYERFCGLGVHWRGIVIQNVNAHVVACYLYDDDIFNVELSALPIVYLKNIVNNNFERFDTVEFIASIDTMPKPILSYRNGRVAGVFKGAHAIFNQFSSTISQYVPHYTIIDNIFKSNLYITLNVGGEGTLIRKVVNNNVENMNLSVTKFKQDKLKHHGQVVRWNCQVLWKLFWIDNDYLITRFYDNENALICALKCDKKAVTPSPGQVATLKSSVLGGRLLTLKDSFELGIHDNKPTFWWLWRMVILPLWLFYVLMVWCYRFITASLEITK